MSLDAAPAHPDREPSGEPDRYRVPYWVAVAAVLLGLVGWFFCAIIVEAVGSAFGSSASNPTPAVNIVTDFLFDAAFVAAALYFTVPRGWLGRVGFGYLRIPLARGVGALVLAAVVYYGVGFVYGALVNVHGTDKLPSGLGVNTSTAATVAVAVYVCAAAPMAEEFFFRGFLFGVLRRINVTLGGRQLGPWIAAAVVGLLFGLAHFDSAQPEFLVPLGFLGFVLCVVRWKTGSLYPCMALHAINNCIALGVNELGWNFGQIVLLTVGALALIAAVTWPLSRGARAVSPSV